MLIYKCIVEPIDGVNWSVILGVIYGKQNKV